MLFCCYVYDLLKNILKCNCSLFNLDKKRKFSMFECNELVENCFPLFCYAPIGK